MLTTLERALARIVVPAFATLLTCTAAHGQVAFTDVTSQAGLEVEHWDGIAPDHVQRADLEMLIMSAGAVAFDFNRDGWCDIFMTRLEAPCMMFRNNGDGTFTDVAPQVGLDYDGYATGCAVGDIDNDGDLDLYLLTTYPDSRNVFFVNYGGLFVEESRGARAYIPDSTHHCTSATFGDYDRDGHIDLMTTAWQSGTFHKNYIYRNAGGGYFIEDSAGATIDLRNMFGFSASFADVDLDGWQDLLVAADFGTSRFYRSLGAGQLRDQTKVAHVGTDENGMGSTLGDIDNDGDLDWFVTSIFDPEMTCETAPCNWGSTGNRLYRNIGNGDFQDDTDVCGVRDGGWGWGASFFDYDNDGDLDLGMTNGVVFSIPYDDQFHEDPVRIWNNDGTGVMTEVAEAVGVTDNRSGKGFLTLDYDNDGDLDLLIANNASTPVLYRNDGGNDLDWIQLKLRGHRSNHSGLGARVYVTAQAGGVTQMREHRAANNYQSQNEPLLHFGLGTRGLSTIHKIRVVWPVSGTETILTNVDPRQRIVVEEPRDKVVTSRP